MLPAFFHQGLTEHVRKVKMAVAGQTRVPYKCDNFRDRCKAEEMAGLEILIGFGPRNSGLGLRKARRFRTFVPMRQVEHLEPLPAWKLSPGRDLKAARLEPRMSGLGTLGEGSCLVKRSTTLATDGLIWRAIYSPIKPFSALKGGDCSA